MASLTVGSLFAGIGGIDLGLQRAGHRIVWHSEIDKFASRVLEKHFPGVPNLGDVTKIEWRHVPYVDIIAGGYPCQPFSTAGKRKGAKDARHLWPYFLDAIRTLRPRYALLENVRGHLTLGFGDVLADLASCGYSAEWQVIPASSVGAPHRRDRLFVVAYPDRERPHSQEIYAAETGESSLSDSSGRGREMADADGRRLEERESETESATGTSGRSNEAGTMADTTLGDGRGEESQRLAEVFREASESGERGREPGFFGYWWETEPDVGRVAHGIPARVERLRGLGNAVVPQVTEWVGRLIAEHAKHN